MFNNDCYESENDHNKSEKNYVRKKSESDYDKTEEKVFIMKIQLRTITATMNKETTLIAIERSGGNKLEQVTSVSHPKWLWITFSETGKLSLKTDYFR